MDILNLNKYRDPADWDSLKSNLLFLGHGPYRLIGMVLVYLVFVLKLGPQLMHKKQALDLRVIVRLYNFLNIIFNVWLAYRGIHLSGNGLSFFNCHCLDRDYKRYSVYIDIFILSRVIDFLDTVFFILRKKQSQITGLHVFHHATVPLVIYLVASFSMTPFSGFLIVMNALVHIIMYTYYYMATFPHLQPYLWWKRHLTKIQIGQFILALIYFCSGYLLLPHFCNDPPMVAVVTNLLSAVVFLILFLSFYSGAYKRQQKEPHRGHNGASTTTSSTLVASNGSKTQLSNSSLPTNTAAAAANNAYSYCSSAASSYSSNTVPVARQQPLAANGKLKSN